MNTLEKILLASAAAVGIIFTFGPPPFQKPDENRHYYQAEALSRGVVGCRVDSSGQIYLPLPTSVATFPDALKAGEIAHTPSVKFLLSSFGWYRYPSADPGVHETSWCSWSPVGYIPNAVGMLLGRVSGSRLVEFYLARLFGLAIFIAALIYGLSLTPAQFRSWLYLFALLPMTLHQASAVSYDVVQLAMVPIAYGLFTRFLVSRSRAPVGQIMIFALSLILLVMVKPAYLPLLGLFFLVPPKVMAPGIKAYRARAALYLFFALAALLPVLRPSYYAGLSVLVNPGLQLAASATHPLHVLSALWVTFVGSAVTFYDGLVGNFGWLDYKLWEGWYFVVPAVFGYLLAAYRGKQVLSGKRLGALAVLLLASVVAVAYSLYLIWTPVGANAIGGIQGRYFLLLVPFAGLLLAEAKRYGKVIAVVLAAIFLASLVGSLWNRYYNLSAWGENDRVVPEAGSGVTKLVRGVPYPLSFPGEKVKLVGLYWYPLAPPSAPIAYTITDHDCTNRVLSGYVQDTLGTNGVHEEAFGPVWVTAPVCVVFSADVGNVAGAGVAPRYLVPSIR